MWGLVTVGEPGECWPYRGRPASRGYGQFMFGAVRHQAHRFVYELSVGPIPDGMMIDHKCHNEDPDCAGGPCAHRMCCNPAHLEPVTNIQNQRRSPHTNANRTHCPQEHPYDTDNTRIGNSGGRYCKTCIRDVYPARRPESSRSTKSKESK